MADQEDRKGGGTLKTERFNVCAFIGFGLHKVELGVGIYGAELETSLRRQGRTERDYLWRQKPKCPLANRISKAASGGRFGNVTGGGTEDISITLGDCFALGSAKYKNTRCDGEKLETPGKDPHTMACFISSAKQQIRLSCVICGTEHAGGRKRALETLNDFHEKNPELPTVSFILTCWNSMRREYTDAIREGVTALIRHLPDGANRDAFISLSLSPHKSNNHRLRRRPSAFSFSSRSGVRKRRIPLSWRASWNLRGSMDPPK